MERGHCETGHERAARTHLLISPNPHPVLQIWRVFQRSLHHHRKVRPCMAEGCRESFGPIRSMSFGTSGNPGISTGSRSRRSSPRRAQPVALEAVTKIDAIFDIERQINGLDAASRLEVRQRLSRPLVADLHDWMHAERDTSSKHNPVAKAIDYMFRKDRWEAFTRFLDDGRICMTNNAAERALRGVALGRKSWLFAGSERGGDRAAFMYSLIVTAKMNDIDPQAWLADVLARLPDRTASQVPGLLPWNWQPFAHPQAA
jgi:hypothetical protein